MKKTLKTKVLYGFIGLLCSGWLSAADNTARLKPNHPDRYTVVQHDTLWDISERFFKDPWLWKAMWYANPQIADPDKIYPGDVLTLMTIDGKVRLTIAHRNTKPRVIKLSPQVRKIPTMSTIPPLKRARMRTFLKNSRIIVDKNVIKEAPKIVATKSDRLITGAGQVLYAGVTSQNKRYSVYGVYRQLQVLEKTDTKQQLGVLFVKIGRVQVEAIDAKIMTIKLLESSQEVRAGDLLLPAEDRVLSVNFMPKGPDHPVHAHIIAVMDTIYALSLYDNVVIDQGRDANLEQGDILLINAAHSVKRQMGTGTIDLPDERQGLLMVYRVLDHLSFGVIMRANQPIYVDNNVLSAPPTIQ